MARGAQGGYNTGLTQAAGTGPANPSAVPGTTQQPTSNISSIMQMMFPGTGSQMPVLTPPNQSTGNPIVASGGFNVPIPGSQTPPPAPQPKYTAYNSSKSILGGGQNPFFSK
jgi:hypothetical protein